MLEANRPDSLAEFINEVKFNAVPAMARSSTAEEGIVPNLCIMRPDGTRVLAAMPDFDGREAGAAMVWHFLNTLPLGSYCVLVHEVFSIPMEQHDRFYVGPVRIISARDVPEEERKRLGVGDSVVLRAWVHDGTLPDLRWMDGEIGTISRDRQSVGPWEPRKVRRSHGGSF